MRGTELINGSQTYQPGSKLVFDLLSVCAHSRFPADIVYTLKTIANVHVVNSEILCDVTNAQT